MKPRALQPDSDADFYARRAMRHIEVLAGEIGPRASTSENEKRAAAYAARVLQSCGVERVRIESFSSARSTYRPYLLAFGVALSSTLLAKLRPSRRASIIGAGAHIAAALSFAREANLQKNWLRKALPTAQSQNVIGVVAARGQIKKRVVVFGHLDSHRTPIFYSSPRWLKAFSKLVALGFGSLVIGALLHALIAWRREYSRATFFKALRGASTLMQSFSLALMAHADATPFSPGANDNASGASVALSLAERAAKHPLENTEVWFLNNGCEEVGCYGIAAFLDAHGDQLRDAFFLDFDMVGIGAPSLLVREGLLQSRHPDARLLEIARRVAREYSHLGVVEHQGGAYTDTGLITSRGFAGITVDSQRPKNHPAEKFMGYWHQMQDVPENIELSCLKKTHEFGWQFLLALDAEN